jgi:endonuclease YncB( thermonuclease family)
MGRTRGLAIVAGAILACFVAPAAADGQAVYPATVTGVSEGDTLTARTIDGQELTVRLIGIDAPELGECGGDGARAALASLADGQAVELESDPAVQQVDGFGRSWFYVDRADGLDIGFELVRRGWAAVVSDPAFARLRGYLDAEGESFDGVWSECNGDFHLTRAEQRHALGNSAKDFVRRYYRRLSNNQFRAAWRMLGGPVKRKLGYGYRRWRSSHRGSLGVLARASRARVSGDRVVITVRLRSRDRDVCDGRAVAQRFAGNVVVAARDDSFMVVKFRVRKIAGRTPRLSKSQCPAPEPAPAPEPVPPAPPTTDCQGYDPCIEPGPDVDCEGGSGNGPRYTGPVTVTGSDPYGLDSDGDGLGCED